MYRAKAMILGFGTLAALCAFAEPAGAAEPRQPSALGSGDLSIELNAVKVARLPAGAVSIVLASPTVALIQLGTAGDLLITGRTLGSTPYLLQDEQGRIVGDGLLRVEIPESVVFLNTAAGTVTYVCRPLCFPEVVPAQAGAPAPRPMQ
jgi:Flp pilus assembly secretin CpaC